MTKYQPDVYHLDLQWWTQKVAVGHSGGEADVDNRNVVGEGIGSSWEDQTDGDLLYGLN